MKVWLGATAALLFSAGVSPQVAILQIQIVEGEGAVHAAGTRRARPLTVEVTDETGRPVAGAAVTFQIPAEGPGGTFSSGLRTDVVTADENGRATVRGLQLNRIPGRFQIRITASKEQARAGIVSFQYIASPKGGAPSSVAAKGKTPPGNHMKWALVAIVVGAAAGGIAAGVSGGSKTAAGVPGAVPTPPAVTTPTSIGPPAITVGAP